MIFFTFLSAIFTVMIVLNNSDIGAPASSIWIIIFNIKSIEWLWNEFIRNVLSRIERFNVSLYSRFPNIRMPESRCTSIADLNKVMHYTTLNIKVSTFLRIFLIIMYSTYSKKVIIHKCCTYNWNVAQTSFIWPWCIYISVLSWGVSIILDLLEMQ